MGAANQQRATATYDTDDRGMRVIAIDKIVGLSEIAKDSNVTVSAVWNWTQRYDFPEPISRVSNKPVWDADEVAEWNKSWVRSPGGSPTHKKGRRM